MHASAKKKQSLQLDLGAVGTFGVDLGVQLPTFVQETIDRVTDIDAHLETVLAEIETNVARAEDATESATQVLRNLICCWPQRGASIGTESGGVTTTTATPSRASRDVAGDSGADSPGSASLVGQESTRSGSTSPARPVSPVSAALPSRARSVSPVRAVSEEGNGALERRGTRRNAISGESLSRHSVGGVEHFSNALADDAPSVEDLARYAAAITESMARGRGRSETDTLEIDFPESFHSSKWKVNWAPERNDVVWSNLHISPTGRPAICNRSIIVDYHWLFVDQSIHFPLNAEYLIG